MPIFPKLPLMACLAALLVVPAAAADRRRGSCGSEQDCAREALQKGEIRPLDEVLAAVRAVLPGDVVGVELERDDGRWIYEIKVLTARGQRQEVEIDAGTLRVLEID